MVICVKFWILFTVGNNFVFFFSMVLLTVKTTCRNATMFRKTLVVVTSVFTRDRQCLPILSKVNILMPKIDTCVWNVSHKTAYHGPHIDCKCYLKPSPTMILKIEWDVSGYTDGWVDCSTKLINTLFHHLYTKYSNTF